MFLITSNYREMCCINSLWKLNLFDPCFFSLELLHIAFIRILFLVVHSKNTRQEETIGCQVEFDFLRNVLSFHFDFVSIYIWAFNNYRGPGPSRGGMTRYEPYPAPAVYPTEPPSIRNMGPLVPDHQTVPPHREEYASEQVSIECTFIQCFCLHFHIFQ